MFSLGGEFKWHHEEIEWLAILWPQHSLMAPQVYLPQRETGIGWGFGKEAGLCVLDEGTDSRPRWKGDPCG